MTQETHDKERLKPCNNGWCLNGGTSNAQCRECNERSVTLEGTVENTLMRMMAERQDNTWIFKWLLDAFTHRPQPPAGNGDNLQLIGYTGSGSVAALGVGCDGYLWSEPAPSHPIPVYTMKAAQQPAEGRTEDLYEGAMNKVKAAFHTYVPYEKRDLWDGLTDLQNIAANVLKVKG